MAAASSVRVYGSVASVNYNSVSSLHSDETRVKTLAANIARFLRKQEWSSKLDHLRDTSWLRYPERRKSCEELLDYIGRVAQLIVVPNEINDHSNSGTILITWERTVDLSASATVAIVGRAGIAALQQQGRTRCGILTISQRAFDALTRYKNTLPEEQVSSPEQLISSWAALEEAYRPIPIQKRDCCFIL